MTSNTQTQLLFYQIKVQILIVEIFQHNQSFIKKLFADMSVNLELIEKNFASILQKTGTESYVPWDQFTKNSTAVVNSIDTLTKWLGILREMQHKNFIQTMKKLKGLDIPDSIESVKSKKLPKEVLKPIIPRFKFENGNLDLVDTKEKLKEEALKEYSVYKAHTEELVQQFGKYIEFLAKKAIEAGYEQSSTNFPTQNLKPFQSTMKFQFDDNQFKKIASKIKVNYIQGTKFIDGNTYNELVDKTFDCIKDKYIDLVKSSRKQQRKNMANHKVYFELIDGFMGNAESLIAEGQRRLYSAIGGDVAKWQENEQALLQKGAAQYMMMVQGGLREKLKKSVESKKQVSLEQAVQVIKYQIKCISERGPDIKAILNDMPKGIESAQIVPVLLSIILNDYIYDAFGYEEEDFMKNLNGMVLFTNPELAEAFGRMEQEILKLMQSLGLIPEDISNMMMGPQGEDMAKMMAEMQGMGLNQGQGGDNPFDMLQAQQMAQFQQMMMGQQPPNQKKDQP